MALSRSCRAALAPTFRPRLFHTSSVLAARQKNAASSAAPSTARRIILDRQPLEYDDDVMEDQVPVEDDAPEPTHKYLEQQRQMLYYLRLIEHEMPKLVAYRKPFVPPSDSEPLVIRSTTYGGEEHPATERRIIVVPVAKLPLKNEKAIHKFKVLAGVRWTPDAPTDSGIAPNENGDEHGYFKISAEHFDVGAMNLKWASDTLDRLIAEANNLDETFADIPVDTRHIEAKIRKAKKGGHIYGRQQHRPTLRDFPKEWLPVQKPLGAPEASTSA